MEEDNGYIIEPEFLTETDKPKDIGINTPEHTEDAISFDDEDEDFAEEGVYTDGFGNVTDEDYDNEYDKSSMRVFYVIAVTAVCIFLLITGLIVADRYFPDFLNFGNRNGDSHVGVVPSLNNPDKENDKNNSNDASSDAENQTSKPTPIPTSPTDDTIVSEDVEENKTDTLVDGVTKLSVTEIYASCVDSVVGITTEGKTTNIFGQVSNNASSGTGIIYSSDGYVLTNYHVVESGSSHTVTLYNGRSYKAKLVGYEAANDIALLKIDATGLKNAVIGDSDKISVGEDIIVIGNPLGELTHTLTRGVVSALNRVINTDSNPKNMFQIDAAVNSGNSGGPAFDACGRVVGIVTAKYSSDTVEGIGFCIPINEAIRIADELKDHGYVRGKSGLEICATDSYLTYGNGWFSSYAIYGAKVTYIKGGGASDKAGMVATDMIVEANGTAISSVAELQNALKKCSIGDTIRIVAYHSDDGRNFDKKTYMVTLGEYSPLKVPSDYSAERYGSII